MTVDTTEFPAGREAADSPRTTLRGPVVLRTGLVVVLIAVAYHRSLAGLLDYLSTDTPLAYVGLVPVLALGLALAKARARPGELRLPDRQFDWIIGLPLVSLALLFAMVLPERLSYSFWTNRIDILGLPLFAAGVVALLLGSRVLYRIRLAIAFLLLAWPFPYEQIIADVQSLTTKVALWGIGKGLPIIGGADVVSDSIYRVGDGSRQFTVNVAPACAGANSAVGFLLVGGAALLLLKGRRTSKLAWLTFGVALMLLLNVGRLLMLFWAGDRYGEEVMIGSLHPYAGLTVFVLGCLVMIALLPRFGLGTGSHAGSPAAESPLGSTAAPLPGLGPRTGPSLTGTKSAFAVVAVLAALLAGQNAQLIRFDAFGPAATARVTASVLGEPLDIAGWSGTKYDEVTWARQYFGRSSSWWRYIYEANPASTSSRLDSLFVDVVNVADVDTFSTYGLEACYRFHGYRVVQSRRVDVGAAAGAQTISYLSTDTNRIWSVVSWVSPVNSATGKRFERVALLASVDAKGEWRPKVDVLTAGLVSFAQSFVATADRDAPRQASARLN